MQLPLPQIQGTLLRRYKRFLADIRLDSGEEVTAHLPNSGSMRSCQKEGWRAVLSEHHGKKRKLPYTLELLHNGTCWICVNTHHANRVVREALEMKHIPELACYDTIRSEVPYGNKSRVDFLLSDEEGRLCYVEVKSVSLLGEDGCYQFPDAVTIRGQKHLQDLQEVVKQGHRAVQLFVVNRSDGSAFHPANEIDPKYAQGLLDAQKSGVEILVYGTQISPEEIRLNSPIPYRLN